MKSISIDLKIIDTIKLILKDFSIPKDEEYENNLSKGNKIERKIYPVPQLVYFIFVKLLDYPSIDRIEKTLWIIPFIYKGIYGEFSLRKFGFHLYLSESNISEIEFSEFQERILRRIIKATSIIEKKVLKPYSKLQLKDSEVTIENEYLKLSDMYNYFREKASEAFHYNESKAKSLSDVTKIINTKIRWKTIGFYNSVAMMDSYFSRLEHLLVISLAFLDYDRKDNALIDYISSNWSEKYKNIFNLQKDNKAKQFYDRLKDIKIRYRNTYSHGGFEKDGASLYFHLPEVGAIPASLSKFDKSPHFRIFPIEQLTFKSLCKLFDEFDEWIEKDKLKYALIYAKSGLDVYFNQESITENKKAMVSEKEFMKLLNYRAYLEDTYVNMDF